MRNNRLAFFRPQPPIAKNPLVPMPLTRSTINRSLRTAIKVAEHFQFALPPYAHWSPDRWGKAGPGHDEIRDCMLGWDVTDFGSGDFANIGMA